MKAAAYSVLLLMQFSTIFGSPFVVQYKCWISDQPCLTARAQALVPSFAAGIPELGTERLDVMILDGLHLNQDGFKADWGTIYYQGLRNTIIDKLSIDLNSKVMNLVFHSDVSLKSHYSAEGNILSMPFFGNGEVTLKLDNVLTEMVIPFEISSDLHGRNVLNLKGYQYWYDIRDGAYFYFDNLFYGDNERSAKTQANLNRQWKYLTVRYGRSLLDGVNDKIFNALRTYALSVPLEDLAFY